MSSLRRPGHKGSIRYTRKPTASLPEFDMVHPSGKTKGFVIHITEAHPPPPGPTPPLETQNTAEQAPRQKPQPPLLVIPPKAYISEGQRPSTPPSPPTSSLPRSQAASPTEIPLPRSSRKSPVLVRSNSGATPIMRSMFPRYNQNIPLTQQQYGPGIERVPGLASAMAVAGTSSYCPHSYSQQAHNRPSSAYLQSEREKQTAAENKESPLRPTDDTEHDTTLSTPEQLLDLWDIANGQTTSEGGADKYVLELSCDDLTAGREIITFNASTSDPLYTLEASDSAIKVSRIHPGNRTPTIQITTSTLEKPTSADPLVASIFPKLAGLRALDHSSTVAVAHKLDRTASAELQADAVRRAQEQEASMLLWDSASDRYCLMHPTLLDATATPLPISIVPHPRAPREITVRAPETHAPLCTLSLRALTLTLHPGAITALPSPHILDALLAALLALLLHLHRSCAPAPDPPRPLFPPPPTLARTKTRLTLPPFRSSKHHPAPDIELQSLPGPAEGWTQEAPTRLVSTDDERLPRTTRAVLRLLYWAFQVLFWLLGVAAQVLAAAVVGAGKLVAKL